MPESPIETAHFEEETIVAISTPVGRGGIGIVRVSGARAREVVEPLLRLRHELKAGRARFAEIVEVSGGKGEEADPCGMTNRDGVDGTEGGKEAEADPCGMTNRGAEADPYGMTNRDGVDRAEGGKRTEADPCGMTNQGAEADPYGMTDQGEGAETGPFGMANQTARGGALDEAVVTFFAGPHSYTSEDVVEIAMHGAPVLLEYVVRQCCAGGARLAEPGEFTQRAFLAGRIDLTQAEAVDDLIGSSTLEQARVAARQMGGALARRVAGPKARLVELIAAMEAGIDFAEDDIDVMATEEIASHILGVRGPLAELERSFAVGRMVREGFSLAIVGRPNAGKSSLFNRLVERERAIVTAMPGTTRDTVTERVSMAGIPVELIDTAGLREGTDEAERMGIARSREAMAEADVVVLVVDAAFAREAGGVGEEERAVLDGLSAGGRAAIVAWNKWDLVREEGEADSFAALRNDKRRAVRTSAVTSEGIEALRAAIVDAVTGAGGVREGGMLTNLRQHQAVAGAMHGLDAGLEAVRAGIPHEMVLLDLYAALRGLDALTGATTNEDVLRLIFSRFCIGK